jgi:hypothetical protein
MPDEYDVRAAEMVDDLGLNVSPNGDDESFEIDDSPSKKSMATMLVEIARERYEFKVSTTGETFGVPKTGAKVTFLLRGGKRSLRAELAREFFRRSGKAAPQQGLADCMLVLEGLAQEAEEVELHLRVARHEGELWLDLGDVTGRTVRVTNESWAVEDQAPILFKRTAMIAPLPTPIADGGGMAKLWSWLNVESADQPLVVAWLVAALFPDIPHPVLGLFGEQGTGKSTAMKMLVGMVDPSPVLARKPPKDAESWVTAVAGSWVVGLDNLSFIPEWLSDSICRAVTGEGDVRRRLYTDADLAVFAYRRCLILNGIDVGAMKGDLTERMLPIHMGRIDAAARLDEEEVWPAWKAAHADILGGLLDVVAGVEGVLPSVRLESKPRMADFGRLLAAVDQLTATIHPQLATAGLARYVTKQETLASDTLEGDDFIMGMSRIITEFKGTSAELLERVKVAVSKGDDRWRSPKGWPANARAVTTRLHRLAPVMRKVGWVVDDDDGNNKDGTIIWNITHPEERVRKSSPPSPPAQVNGGEPTPAKAGQAGQAGQTAGQAGQTTPSLTSQDGEAGQAGQESEQSQDAIKVLTDLFGNVVEQQP